MSVLFYFSLLESVVHVCNEMGSHTSSVSYFCHLDFPLCHPIPSFPNYVCMGVAVLSIQALETLLVTVLSKKDDRQLWPVNSSVGCGSDVIFPSSVGLWAGLILCGSCDDNSHVMSRQSFPATPLSSGSYTLSTPSSVIEWFTLTHSFRGSMMEEKEGWILWWMEYDAIAGYIVEDQKGS